MLGDTVMDMLARWHRMRGDPMLWLPGVDHAGLSTQVAVRRRLAKEGINIDALPREELLRQVERWKEEHEARIRRQIRAGGLLRRLDRGFATRWTRGNVRATREVFVSLYGRA